MIYLFTLEPLPNRYTTQWKRWIREELPDATEIDGNIVSNNSSSTFLNFADTNIWKAEQIIKIAELFKNQKIKDGDKFLFYDGWHYGALSVRYMAQLHDIKIKMYAMWHAGSYDPHDLLNKANMQQYKSSELGLFELYDYNFVATDFHKRLIQRTYPNINNIVVTGFPFKFDDLDKYKHTLKKDIVIFPHRLAEEKKYRYFKDEIVPRLTSNSIGVYICQESKLTKDEYYQQLSESKVCLSLAEQETWGISMFESLYLNTIPLMPDHLSYTEMYESKYKYDYSAIENPDMIVNKILHILKNFNYDVESNIQTLKEKFCTFDNIKELISD